MENLKNQQFELTGIFNDRDKQQGKKVIHKKYLNPKVKQAKIIKNDCNFLKYVIYFIRMKITDTGRE